MTSLATPATAVERVRFAATELQVETPSWGYGNSGTRFKVFAQPGVPRTPFEKVEDAATVGKFTGVAKSIALHIPWDRVEDFSALTAFARERGVAIGGINSNTFQDEDYKLGALCHPSLAVRRKAIDHVLECCDIARQTGSHVVKVWLSDGTNYPGQDDFRARRRRLIDSLKEVYPALPSNARLFLEYKLYEPAFYHTDVQDWGQALTVCQHVGERAQVCVDTGHHAMGVNIEQIVAYLLQEARLGGFDLNDKKYGDDDLMVGSIDPYQLFRILHELVKARADQDEPQTRANALDVVYMLDQCHNVETKMPAVIRSVMNLQEAFAKALLVDQTALETAQREGDVLEANSVLKDAYDTDVRPLLGEARRQAGLPEDPYRAYLASGEQERRVAERIGGVAMGWQ